MFSQLALTALPATVLVVSADVNEEAPDGHPSSTSGPRGIYEHTFLQ